MSRKKPIQRNKGLRRNTKKLTFCKADGKQRDPLALTNDIKIAPPPPGAFDGKKHDYIYFDEVAQFAQDDTTGFVGLLSHAEGHEDYRVAAVREFESRSRQQYFGAVIVQSRRYGTQQRQWYMYQSQTLVNVCQECFAFIGRGESEQVSSVAHLLPKEKYWSVMLHMLNSARLGSHCGCHTNYDNSWESASWMRVWPWAKRIIQEELMPLLTAREFGGLPDLLTADYTGPIPAL